MLLLFVPTLSCKITKIQLLSLGSLYLIFFLKKKKACCNLLELLCDVGDGDSGRQAGFVYCPCVYSN